MTFRNKVSSALILKRDNSLSAKVFHWLLIGLILLNVAAVMLESVESIRQQYSYPLFVFEVFSVTVFTIEYLLRIWTVVDNEDTEKPAWKVRLAYMCSPMAIIDLIAILPFYLGLFIDVDLRFLRILRLVRVAKLGRYSSAMQMLFQVFQQEYKILVAALFLLLVLMVIASSGIYLIEHDVQPDEFGNIPQAMWWAMATLTTVGYGDVTPITPMGKFFGGTITVISMAMVALPAGILASSFSELLRKKRDKFRARIKAALADGVLEFKELEELENLRKSLGMDRSDAEELFNLINNQRKAFQQSDKPEQKQEAKHTTCPHCGKDI